MFYPQWGSLLTDETSLAVWGLQGSPGAILDSALLQGIAKTPWDGGMWRPELVQVHLGLNLSPIAPPVLSHCGNPARPLQCLELFMHKVLHQGTVLKPIWAILSQTRWCSADLSANHLCNQCQISRLFEF